MIIEDINSIGCLITRTKISIKGGFMKGFRGIISVLKTVNKKVKKSKIRLIPKHDRFYSYGSWV